MPDCPGLRSCIAGGRLPRVCDQPRHTCSCCIPKTGCAAGGHRPRGGGAALRPLMGAALDRELTRSNSPFEARWNAAGQVQVYLHYDSYRIPPSRTQLRVLGASGVVTSAALGVVQAWVPATRLDAVAALPQVARVTVPRYAYVKRAPRGGAIPRTGSVDTQGDQILGAAAFRQATGFNGSGTSVG